MVGSPRISRQKEAGEVWLSYNLAFEVIAPGKDGGLSLTIQKYFGASEVTVGRQLCSGPGLIFEIGSDT